MITLTFNIIVLLVFIVFCLRLLFKSFYKSYFAILFMFQGFTAILSMIYIENGGYVSELDTYGSFNFSTLIYTIFQMTSIYIIYKIMDLLDKKIEIKVAKIKNEIQIIQWSIILILAVLYVNLALSPIPLFDLDVDRVIYWKVCKFSFLKVIFGTSSAFISLSIGLIYLSKPRTGNLLFISYILYIVLIGNKFSALVAAIYLFYLPYIIIHRIEKINLRKIFSFKLLLAFSIIVGAVYYHYSDTQFFRHVVGNSVILNILYRAIALQGHVWWGVIEKISQEGYSPNFEIGQLWYGMHYLMRLLSPNEFLEESIARGMSMTNGYPAILVYVFSPWIAYIINILFMSIYGFIAVFAKHLLNSGIYIWGLILVQITVWLNFMFFMAYFYKLNLIMISVFIVLISILTLYFYKNLDWKYVQLKVKTQKNKHAV